MRTFDLVDAWAVVIGFLDVRAAVSARIVSCAVCDAFDRACMHGSDQPILSSTLWRALPVTACGVLTRRPCVTRSKP